MSAIVVFVVYLAVCHVNVIGKPTWEDFESRPLPPWYDSARIGIFVNLDLYSGKMSPTDWFWRRWISGDKEAKQTAELVEDGENKAFVFKASKLDPEQWADLFHRSGARYVVLGAKNSDGFTMFPSGRPKWNSVEVGPKRDIVDIVSKSLKRYGIKFGIYYSLSEGCNKLFLTDMQQGNTSVYTDTIVWDDIKLLVVRYKPSLLWADGDEDIICNKSPECSYWKSPQLLSWLYRESPVRDEIVVSDRWCRETQGRHGDYFKFNSSTKLVHAHKWELVFNVINQTLYYRMLVDPEKVMTIDAILRVVVNTVSYGGNVLIDVQPTKDGIILPIVQERLLKLGRFLNNNHEAIYNSSPCNHQTDSFNNDVYYTCAELQNLRARIPAIAINTVYVIFLKWPVDNDLKIKDVTYYIANGTFTVDMINPVMDEHCGKEEVEYIRVTYAMEDDIFAVDLSNPSIVINDMHAWVLKIKIMNY